MKRHAGHFKNGPQNPRWNNGKTINGRGYIMVYAPEHVRADKNGYVYEHYLVLEKMLGRPVLPPETGHHLDGNKQNNDPKNLVLFATRGMHTRFHRWLQRLEKAFKTLRED